MSFKINKLLIKNSRLIANLTIGRLVFSQGRFDNRCIYFVENNMAHAIKDVEIFRVIPTFRATELKYMFYQDFCCIFSDTTSHINPSVIRRIKSISSKYPVSSNAEYIFMFLYAGMVAEENKQHAIIKKFMKRLGVHQVLIEGMTPELAASYTRGKSWKHIFAECELRGFSPNRLAAVA